MLLPLHAAGRQQHLRRHRKEHLQTMWSLVPLDLRAVTWITGVSTSSGTSPTCSNPYSRPHTVTRADGVLALLDLCVAKSISRHEVNSACDRGRDSP